MELTTGLQSSTLRLYEKNKVGNAKGNNRTTDQEYKYDIGR